MSRNINDPEQQRFEAWARDEGLIQESHGIMSVSSMTNLARKAWDAAQTAMPDLSTITCWVLDSEGALCQAVEKASSIVDDEQAFVRLSAVKDLLVRQVAAPKDAKLPEAEPSAREQKLAERVDWNTKQWYEHVGAWANDTDEIVFGTVMALHAMLVQFQAVTLYAAGQCAASQPSQKGSAS